MASAPCVLVVDSDGERALVLRQLLTASGFEAAFACTVAEGTRWLEHAAADVIIAGAADATDLARLIAEAGDANLVVRVDARENPAASARRWDAYDFVSADATSDVLLGIVDRAARDASMRRELALLRSRAAAETATALIGRSAPITQLREMIGRAAASRRTVLVTGEAGAGKDAVARLIHDLSDRASRPYLLVRCTDTGTDALEEELFGVARSRAMTGRAGLLETARGGTIVFDECTALTGALRQRIARAILERSATRIGDSTPVALDVRYLLMSRSNAGADSGGGADGVLAGGVLVDPIVVPPLRARRSDIPLLVQYFRARLASEPGFVPATPPANWLMTLLAQEWPGNVRELQHHVERNALGTSEVPRAAPATPGSPGKLRIPNAAPWTLEQLERRYIEHVLELEHGNQSKAAERLGIDRRTLYRKLKEYRDERIELSEAV